jgi:ankyrin repeat protein
MSSSLPPSLRRALKKYASMEEIKRTLKSSPELAFDADEDGWLLLHYACANKASIDVIQYLLSKNLASAQHKTHDGVLPLHIACANRAAVGVVELLLSEYPDAAHVKSKDGVLPIHYACSTNASSSVVQTLLDVYPEGAKTTTAEGWLPLHFACRYRASVSVVKTLLDSYPKSIRERDYYGELPLHVACRWQPRVEVVQVLTEHYPEAVTIKDILFFGKTPIDCAIECGASPTVIMFLQSALTEEQVSLHSSQFPTTRRDRHLKQASFVEKIKSNVTITGGSTQAILSGFRPRPKPEWTLLPPMLQKRWGFARATLDSETFLVIGGYDENWKTSSTCEGYNATSDTWTRWPSLNFARNVHTAAYCNGKVYVFGGQNAEAERLSTVECLDLSAKERRWVVLDQHLTACGEGGAAVTLNNCIYVIGGHDGTGNELSMVEIFDTATGEIRQGPSMTTKRAGCAATAVGNTIWVVGGYDADWNVLNTAESLTVDDSNPDAGWVECPAVMGVRRVFPSVTTIGDCVVTLGGKDDNGFNLPFVEILDTKRLIWWRLPRMKLKRWASGAVTLQRNTIVVIGGRSEGTTFDSVESLELIPATEEELDDHIREIEAELHRMTRSSRNPFGRGKREEKVRRLKEAKGNIRRHRHELKEANGGDNEKKETAL